METQITKKVSLVLQFIMTELDTSTRIREKAHSLFMQFGLRSVSMDDIANSLGMSKKTIYQYYTDKDELIIEVIGKEISHSRSICEADRSSSENAVHEIFKAMDMVMEMFAKMNPSLLYDMQKYHPKSFLKFQEHKNEYLFNVIRENIERGIREELYREDIKIEVLARYRVATMMISFQPDFSSKLKHKLVDMESEILLHFLYGLASAKGHKLIQKYQQERKKIINDGKN